MVVWAFAPPPDDDPLLPPLDEPDVEVRVLLLVGALAPVALDVGLGHGEGEVLCAAASPVGRDARGVARPLGLVQVMGDDHECEQGVGADGLDDVQDAPGPLGGLLDQLHAAQQVLGASGQREIPAVGSALPLGDHEELTQVLPLGEAEDGGAVLNADSQDGMGRDILHATAPLENRPTVPQASHIFFG